MRHILIFGHPTLAPAFRTRGWLVTTVGRRPESDLVVSQYPIDSLKAFRAASKRAPVDCALFCDESTLPILSRVGDLPVPTVWYAVDTHIHGGWHRDWQAMFDVVLVAQKSKVQLYEERRLRGPVYWCPLYADHLRIKPPEGPRGRGVVFVGNLNANVNPQRVAFFSALSQKFPVAIVQGPYEDFYGDAHVGINQSLDLELNFRNFEIPACGAALVTERGIDGIEACFTEGEHYLTYSAGNVEEAADLLDALAVNHEYRERLQCAAYHKVMKSHLDVHRVDQIEMWLQGLDLTQLVTDRFMDQDTLRNTATSVFQFAAKVYESHGRTREADVYQAMIQSL